MMDDSEETKYCSNCKRNIAAANFVMHEVHCRRNIILCKHCEEPVPRTEVDDHYEEYHIEVACEVCNASVEKQKIEEHKDVCPKRSTRCVYCEIDLPFCDLKDHLEFCGTRTEPCVKCGQYIMQKDMQRHEDSDCSYPQPKPTLEQNGTAINNSGMNARSSNHQNGTRGRLMPDEYYNNFAMGELGRILHNDSIGGIGTGRNTFQGGGIRASNPTAATRQPARPQASSQGVQGTKRTNVKKTYNTPLRNRNVNQSIPFAAPPSRTTNHRSPEMQSVQNDLDELLARHLAQDLGEEDFSGAADTNDNPSSPNVHTGSDELSGNQTTLPCEFCDELFPIDALLHHQATCLPDLGGEGIAIPNVNLNPEPEIDSLDLPNNSPRRAAPLPEERPPDPPIVDNLSYLAAHDWLANPSAEFAEDILLPCEFCDVLFPEDLLIQHQAVCDSSRARTPHVPPSAARPSGNSYSQSTPLVSLSAAARNRVTRRQNDPSFDFQNHSNDDYAGANRYAYKPKISKKKNTNVRSSAPNAESERNGPTNSRNFGPRKNWPSSSGSQNNTNPNRTDADDGSMPAQRRKGSATRVRQTLEHLVDDTTANGAERPWSSSTYTLDKDEKSSNNRRVQQGEKDSVGPPAAQRGRQSGYEPSFAAGAAGSGTKPQASKKPKPVPQRGFDAEFPNTDRGAQRNSRGGGASTSSRINSRKSGSKNKRQPQGDV